MDSSNEKNDSPKIFEKSTYTWILPKFAQLKKEYENGKRIESPVFPQVERKYKWKLHFYPNSGEAKSSSFVSLYLKKTTDPQNAVFTKYALILQNSNDVTLAKEEYNTDFYETSLGYAEFLSHEKLMSSILDGIVKIRVVIFAEILTLQSHHTVDPPGILSLELGLLYESGNLSDFTFRFNEDDEIPVHRAILAARSSVFSAMFTHDTSENKLGYTQICDVERNIMSILLEFIYTGNLKSTSTEETGKLLVAAEKYELMELKLLCAEKLSEEFAVSNILDILLTAELNNVPSLKSAAFDYVRKNTGKFSDSTKFDKIKNYPDLLVELITEMSKSEVKQSPTEEIAKKGELITQKVKNLMQKLFQARSQSPKESNDDISW